ncbi:3-hydroxyanthranilate 3,4-dioxygenase-like [Uloborus diversus]|uniref:3-hydroxyanthranilate 3,4-dioxygenase-like n=1 Tax=Uloborus diversus TaxID=327109 RepID=UPI00240A1C7D|nr:3-hydroxyanthranilate 3,4-dioxygenase-like [Uloborus diversus]
MAPVINDVNAWLDENKKYFQPPICNKLMHQDGQLKAFFVGGPNSRKDFHMEAGEEFFYMLKGDMRLVVSEKGQFKDLPIREGEVFLLPKGIPHSPQRSEDTIGLVVERERLPEELDCLRYYVEDSDEILYEKWFHCDSLEGLVPLIKEFFASEQHRTGKPIPGTIPIDKPVPQDIQRQLELPFSLNEWLKLHRHHLDTKGKKTLFEGVYASRVNVLGAGIHKPDLDVPETFLWQLEGVTNLKSNGKMYTIKKNQTALLNQGEKYELENVVGSRTLSVVMNVTET